MAFFFTNTKVPGLTQLYIQLRLKKSGVEGPTFYDCVKKIPKITENYRRTPSWLLLLTGAKSANQESPWLARRGIIQVQMA